MLRGASHRSSAALNECSYEACHNPAVPFRPLDGQSKDHWETLQLRVGRHCTPRVHVCRIIEHAKMMELD